MNYYEHHLGDWAAATGHLTWDEDMAYTRLLRAYYHHEKPIAEGQQYRMAKASTPAQRKAVDQVLAEFFELRDGSYHQKRADSEIARYQDKQRKAKASAEARWSQSVRNANAMRTHDSVDGDDASASRKESKPYKELTSSSVGEELRKSLILHEQGHANAMRTHSEGNALQTPDTRHQTPEEGPDVLRTSSPAEPPDRQRPTVPCPYSAIVDAYHEALPELPRVRLMTAKRQQAMRRLWGWVLSSRKADGTPRATSADDALAWLRAYFGRASANDFLMGRGHRSGEHAGWTADLDFLLSERGMKHVIERTEVAA